MFSTHTYIKHIFCIRCLVAWVTVVRTLVPVPSRVRARDRRSEERRNEECVIF
jgi:hypothetical protein